MGRTLFLLCALVATVGIAVGSGAFSSASADRGVSVTVVEDEDAYMALDDPDKTIERNGTVGESVTLPVVNVTNQFTDDVDITVEYTVSGTDETSATGANGPTDLDLTVGHTEHVSTEVTCDSAGDDSVSVEFYVKADGNGVFAETSRDRSVSYAVHCDGKD